MKLARQSLNPSLDGLRFGQKGVRVIFARTDHQRVFVFVQCVCRRYLALERAIHKIEMIGAEQVFRHALAIGDVLYGKLVPY